MITHLVTYAFITFRSFKRVFFFKIMLILDTNIINIIVYDG